MKQKIEVDTIDPFSVIWADIDYMDGFRVFSTDPIRFPMDQYNAFLDELHEEDMKHVRCFSFWRMCIW